MRPPRYGGIAMQGAAPSDTGETEASGKHEQHARPIPPIDIGPLPR